MKPSTTATSFIFGGHIGPQTKTSLGKEVRKIANGPNGGWILDTLAGMPRYWEAVTEKIPEVASTMQGPRLLAGLESWFRTGSDSDDSDSLAPDAELPDLWLGILMVAIQLDQYWRYLESRFADTAVDDLQAELVKEEKVEAVGFCAGMIAAVAIASSHTRQEFEQYGAVALRIAALMAVLVGATEEWTKATGKGRSVSIATAWRTRKQGEDLARIVSKMSPDAYISVILDDARATVTVSERLAPKLARQLRAAGVTAIQLAFRGQLHSPTAERERLTEAVIELCHAMPGLQYPDAARLALPINQVDGHETGLVGMVLRSMLVKQLDWTSTASKLALDKELSRVEFGFDRPLPPPVVRAFGAKLDYTEVDVPKDRRQPHDKDSEPVDAEPVHVAEPRQKEEAIAVVGMSLKVAGANDLDEFQQMLKTGQSQHQLITDDRMTPNMMFRDKDASRKWYGNFVRDPDAFDHKFFKKSPRESMAIDPQGRLSLEAAYQALEQSGYFNELAMTSAAEQERKKHVGVYVGLCSYEYDSNVHCHPPSAFTTTGELRSFIPGRVSHYFGWTGPSLTFDTACSSSTVALHNACRDLLSGEVPAALCGGVNVLTSLQWTQNLAAGSFISPTGQCKPFDSGADGYCRGDGIAYVFLKKLSTAVADGNTVLGTIRSTGVNQNLNTTPLFVPNVPSLSTLFNEVIRKARVDPREISLVECHGTGTPVGDPAEWQSIRNAVAGPRRDTVLPIGSAKGHVGHTEGASGLVSLIKVLLMMRGNFIPPQASFNTMNPGIHAQPSDNMEVVTALRSWPGARKVALLNNYGACGSNSSAIVAHSAHKPGKGPLPGAQRLPFWISGLDARSIAAYSTALAPYLQTQSQDQTSLADVSFNMKWQSNPGLSQGMIFSCSTVDELQAKLAQAARATKDTALSVGIAPVKPERPVILCFGGQVSTFIALDRAVYEGASVFRHHLDTCNAAITSHGLQSIYPDIFSSEPYQDTIKLQTALFAVQYASARAWMDCGIADKVVSVVGHSFGEITALCVAGVLSLEDTVQLIAGRARLVQTAWGPDSGSMMAIEADEAVVQALLQESNAKSDGTAGIACYNGPRSFTVAGSTRAIDAFAATLPGKEVKSKRLNVTNAFHSALVEGIVERLGEVGKRASFHDAVIPIERATEHGADSESTLDWTFVGSHMRQPVFFHHAVQRLAAKHPEAIFLEAGSNSTITVMASRALASPQSQSQSKSTHHFQSIAITNTSKGIDRLTDATVDLWKQGLRVSFWAHHRLQKDEYAQLLLPPYQFEKTRHWLELKSPVEQALKIAQVQDETKTQQEHANPTSLDMWTFLGFQEHKKKSKLARFRINTSSDKYQRLFATHFIAKTAPIAPATLEIDIAIEALFSLNPEWRRGGFSPTIRDMLSHSPMCADSTREYLLDLESRNAAETEWNWTIHSTSSSSSPDKHAEGRITMNSPSDPAALQEFGRWKRTVTYAQCQAVLALGPHDEGVEALQGRNVYRAFEDVVDLGPVYRGVKYIVGVGQEKGEEKGEGECVSAGIVHKQHSGDTWLDVPRADCYGQIAGMYVNLLTDIPGSDMFVATGLELVMRSPDQTVSVTDGRENGSGIWHVLARHARQGEKAYVTDIFVFDAETGALAEVILGLQYVRVPKATMSKILARVTTDKSFVRSTAASLPPHPHPRGEPLTATATAATKPAPPKATNIANKVCNVVANVSGIEASELSLDSEMADLGIDSLMAMEVAREMETTFHCTLDSTETMVATSIRDFAACVSSALARAGQDAGGDGDGDGGSSSTESDSVLSDWGQDTDSDISTPDDASVITSKSHDPVSGPLTPAIQDVDRGDVAAREAEALRLVEAYTAGWESPALKDASNSTITGSGAGAVVIVTGASGSLGSHIVQALAERPDVASVVCINRAAKDTPPESRQEEALSSRGITLSPTAREKLHVYGTDTSKTHLGLSNQEYTWLAQHGTHIIHNAWPMSATRPLKAFEPQLQVMRNLLDLARDMALEDGPRRIGFQFISSIGVTGFSDKSPILEQPMAMAAAIPSGYNEAKWACERMLADTLRRHPRVFRAMMARPGQVSGSTASGFWNPVEHFAFVVKSAHALKLFPDLQGVLHWLPVDKSAGVMVDLLNIGAEEEDSGEVYPVYHVDNPVGQSWKEMVLVLAASLDIPAHGIVPFREWIRRVRESSLPPAQNPASMGLGFLESHFERMACGGIVLDTQHAKEHSKTMAAQGPVSAEVVRSYVSSWKAMGFLH
ncbi:putative polyketide synthase [Aspergillus puulaauensis]|uniref:Type I iterative PKS n=1 Tax=Aspergillus puulaauensis TaxID=1220207 RepID=A0A7R7XMZ6_9EURO|nr:type I iterative PKS [Aspergillus puulaauensis]BCS24259.1 type I iterative PKS [Aspergillus puulaauensis]